MNQRPGQVPRGLAGVDFFRRRTYGEVWPFPPNSRNYCRLCLWALPIRKIP